MGLNTRTTLCNSEFDFTKATEDDVYFAYVIKLPFRLRSPTSTTATSPPSMASTTCG